MNKQKPLYLLAGGRGSSNNAIFKAVLREIGKPHPVVGFVGAANEDDPRFFSFMGAEIKRALNCTLIQAMTVPAKADIPKAREILESVDAVFMAGGDVEVGMQVLEQKKLTLFLRKLYEQGKVFFGGSAGSIMLAREWVRWRNPDDDSTAELFPCLGIAPVICDTHAEEDDWIELKTALKLKGINSIGYGIPSGACLKINPDGEIEALGKAVARYTVRQAQQVESLSDLAPAG